MAQTPLRPASGHGLRAHERRRETILHAAIDLRAALPEALVAADVMLYPERRNVDNRIGPDVAVVLGAGTRKPNGFFFWREGSSADWVLEVAKPGMASDGFGTKRCRYAAMGVREYWLFDPQGRAVPSGTPPLQGLRLVHGGYEPIAPHVDRGVAAIRSEVLLLDLRREGDLLRFRDAATGEDIRHHNERRTALNSETALHRVAAAYAVRDAAHVARETAAGLRQALTRKVALPHAARRSGVSRLIRLWWPRPRPLH